MLRGCPWGWFQSRERVTPAGSVLLLDGCPELPVRPLPRLQLPYELLPTPHLSRSLQSWKQLKDLEEGARLGL